MTEPRIARAARGIAGWRFIGVGVALGVAGWRVCGQYGERCEDAGTVLS